MEKPDSGNRNLVSLFVRSSKESKQKHKTYGSFAYVVKKVEKRILTLSILNMKSALFYSVDVLMDGQLNWGVGG